MKSTTLSTADKLTLGAGIVVIGLFAWLFADDWSQTELLLSHNLFDTFAKASTSATEAKSSGTALLRFGIACGFAAFGTIAAYRVSKQLLLIVFLQLLALNLVLHTILTASGVTLAMPIALTLGSALGIGFGCLERRKKDLSHQVHANATTLETLSEELAASKLQLIKDDEIERRVLAGDLHDQVLNDLKLLREKTNKLSAESIDADKKEMDELIVRSMQQIRDVMDSLSPAVLQHLGIVDAIEDCIRNGSERGGYKVRFRCNIDHKEFEPLGQIEQSLLYRLVQESVTNICKHANASTVKCVITADGGKIQISINDDGKGIEKLSEFQQSRGMRYMQQRASIIGADVRWVSGDDGKGTKVEITITKPK